ncbi:MAG: site-specific integrase [Candidatus Dormibacteria bacterium]
MSTTKRRGAGEGNIRQRNVRRERIRADGTVAVVTDRRWEARTDDGYKDGRRQQRSVFGRTRQEAVAKLRIELKRVADGLPRVDQRTTLAAFLESWLESVRPRVRPATHLRYAGLIRHQVIPELGHVRLAKLTPAQVGAMLSRLADRGLSPRTCAHARTVLRTALGDAERWGDVSRNVAKLADPPRVPRPSPRTLPPSEVNRVLNAARETPIANLVVLTLHTGMRAGEVLGLRWSDVDLEGRQLTVGSSLQRLQRESRLVEPKSEHSRRTLRLSGPAIAALQSERRLQLEAQLAAGPRWQPSIPDLCFTTAMGQPMMGSTVTRQFQTALDRAGLPRLRFHHLRHLFGSLMLAGGVDLATVSHMLGHASVALTASTYAGILPTLRDDATDRLERLLATPG